MCANLKECLFNVWCPKCEYYERPDVDDPCDECLEYPSQENSTKPVMFKEATKKRISK